MYRAIDVLENLKPPLTVYFLGGVDVGKTRLVTGLAQRLISKGVVAVLDADIGQSSILPMTISLLRADRPFTSLGELPVVARDFIPGFNLVRNLERNARTMGEMAKQARALADYCLVDTTGFVTGAGIRLKRREIEAARPDLIVGIQRTSELMPIIKDLPSPILLLAPAAEAKTKTEAERTRWRNERLASYFRRSAMRRIALEMVDIGPRAPAGKLAGLYGDRFLGLGLVKAVRGGKLILLTPVRARIQRVEVTGVKFRRS